MHKQYTPAHIVASTACSIALFYNLFWTGDIQRAILFALFMVIVELRAGD